MTQDDFRLIASGLPDNPGIYKYINAEDEILYVGKAKNLKKFSSCLDLSQKAS